jgi:nucleotide-binding universal stress UspA family protein
MAAARNYVVPVDFSKTSEVALDHAIKLAKENRGKLLLIHVIPTSATMMSAPEAATPTMMVELENAQRDEARAQMNKLVRKKKLKPESFRSIIVNRGDPAQVIANQAKKSRAAMIVMGSHGRTGLKRLVLGSVAERSLRYARCPVLIVKK